MISRESSPALFTFHVCHSLPDLTPIRTRPYLSLLGPVGDDSLPHPPDSRTLCKETALWTCCLGQHIGDHICDGFNASFLGCPWLQTLMGIIEFLYDLPLKFISLF